MKRKGILDKGAGGVSWPSSVFLSAAMALHLFFFNTPGAADFGQQDMKILAQGAAWAYNLFVLIIFTAMMRTGNTALYRRILFVAIALLFFPTFIAHLVEYRGQMTVTAEDVFQNNVPFCHIVLPMTAVPLALTRTLIFPASISQGYASFFSMLTIWLAATLILGRGWCSWVCFYGGWDDGFSRLKKKAVLKLLDDNERLRYTSFAVLIFTVLASLPVMSAVYCEWMCPFKMVTEYAEVTGFQSTLAFLLTAFLFFALTLLLPALTRKRTQCGCFCPFGAFQSLAGKLSPFRINIDHTRCVQCMKCVRICPTLSLSSEVIRSKRSLPLVSCTLCGECITGCPKQAIDYALICHSSIGRHQDNQKSRRFGRFMDELTHPRTLVQFAGTAFGFIISSGFAVGTIYRFFHLVLHGTFFIEGGF